MLEELRPALVLTLLFTLVTGIAYPFAVTGFAQAVLPAQANGGLVFRNGVAIGSALIGQNFESARYFRGRPSATNAPDPKDSGKTIDAPYNAANSGAANLGPTSKALMERLTKDAVDWRALAGVGLIPGDAITTSASGLDPDISPQTALAQAASVAKARNLPPQRVRAMIENAIERPLFGLLGEPRVNVLRLNLDLDRTSAD